MAEVGTTTHDEWYGDLRQGPNLDGWYDHVMSPRAQAIEEATRKGIMDGTIESTVVDTGCTTSVGKCGCGITLTGKPSHKVFTVATGQHAAATEDAEMDHDLREPACTFHMVPDVTLDPLCSSGQVCDAGYIKVFDSKEVRIYDAKTTKIVTSKPPVLKVWRDTLSRLWKIPIHRQATVPHASLAAEQGTTARPTAWTPQKIHSPIIPAPSETIANVYQLKTKPEVIRYLHAAAGFPTESTWYSAVRSGNFTSWPWLTPKNVRAHFPESEETQKGHMRNTQI